MLGLAQEAHAPLGQLGLIARVLVCSSVKQMWGWDPHLLPIYLPFLGFLTLVCVFR